MIAPSGNATMALCLSAVWQVSNAAEYLVEISGGRFESEVAGERETDTRSLSATYYFKGAEDSRGPYALAPFLSQSSQVSAAINREEGRSSVPVISGSSNSVRSVAESSAYSISGRYIWPGSGWFMGAGFHQADADLPPSSTFVQDTELDARSVSFGKYINDYLRADLTWRSATSTTDLVVLSCPVFGCILGGGDEIEVDEYEASVFFSGRMSDMWYTLSGGVVSGHSEIRFIPAPQPVIPFPGVPILPPPNLPGGVIVAEVPPLSLGRSKTYSIAGELFPRQALGVRLEYARWDDDAIRDDRYELSATWFIRPDFALRFATGVIDRKARPGLDDVEHVELRLLARF